jgi:hypothetical protein
MPSMLHELLLALFRNRPTLAAEVIRDALGVPVPSFGEARLEPSDLTEVVPRELRADQVVVLYEDGDARLAIVVEAQLQVDSRKAFTWLAYLAGARLRYGCPACVLVVTTDEQVAAWSSAPVSLGPCGSVLRPLVLGPEGVPVITTPEAARPCPELSVLSAMAHGRSAMGEQIGHAALTAVDGLDEERAQLYADVVLTCLGIAARRALEEGMASGNYEYQSDFARKYFTAGKQQGEELGEQRGEQRGKLRGKADALLLVLKARGLSIPKAVRARVLSCTDVAELNKWLQRAAVVSRAEAIFDKGAAGAVKD